MNVNKFDDTEETGVWETARAIRPYLKNLLGPKDGPAMDHQLAKILTKPDERSSALRDLLKAYSPTSRFLDEVVADGPNYRPPYLQPDFFGSVRGSAGRPDPAGVIGPIVADKYICPRSNDYTWYLPDVGTKIPDCPSHHVTLIRARLVS